MSSFKLISKHNIPELLSLSDDEDGHTGPLFMIDKAPAPACKPHKDPVMREKRQLSRLLSGASASKLLSSSTSASLVFESKAETSDAGFLSRKVIGPIVGRGLGRKQRREEAAKTAGANWFHMPATEVDEVVERDVSLVNMRDAMSANRFYKRNSGIRDLKYFSVGTVISSAADFHNDLSRRMRKRTLAEELAADVETRAWHKRKYNQVLATDPYYLKQKRRQQAKRDREKRLVKEMTAGQPDDDTPVTDNRNKHYPGRRQQQKQNVFQKRSRK